MNDHHLLFVDIASPQTIANLRNNPRIEINSFDFIRRRGYRFAGTARCLNPVIRSTTGGGPGYWRFRVHDDATVRLIWHLDFGGPPRKTFRKRSG